MSEQPRTSSIADRYRSEAVSLALMLALVAAAWWFLKLKDFMAIGFAVCILLGPLWPPKWAWLGTLLGMLGLAALAFFKVGPQTATIFAVLGVIFAGMRWNESRRHP